VLRTVNDRPTLWDAILPAQLLVLPAELGRVDVLLDDPVFFAPFASYSMLRSVARRFRWRPICG
jgi:IS5 family transposase